MTGAVVIYLSFPMNGRQRGGRGAENTKNPIKKRKSLLTNLGKRDILEKFQARAWNAVPCKLNNVKTNYNTLDN